MSMKRGEIPVSGVTWSDIHRRLEAVDAAIDTNFTPSPEDQKRILRARADALAKKPQEEKEGEHMEVVEFLLSNEHYGIESHYIREVYPIKDFTPLSCAPPFVLGLINVRGQIFSVINLKQFFHMDNMGISDLNKVIIIRNESMEFGILADCVIGVHNIAISEIEPPLPSLTGICEDFLKGITRDRMVILDAKSLLEDKNIIVHEEV